MTSFLRKPTHGFFFFLLLLTFFSCKKQKEVDTFYIPQFLKDYTFFNKGSYWIFKNEVTEELDSCYIISASNYFYHEGGYDTDPLTEHEMIIFQSSFLLEMDADIDQVNMSFHSTGGYCLRASISPPIYNYGNNSKYEYFGELDTLKLNEINFLKVVNTQYTMNGLGILPYNSYVLTFYLAKSIGLIKYRQQMDNYDTTWSLIRYHIEQ